MTRDQAVDGGASNPARLADQPAGGFLLWLVATLVIILVPYVVLLHSIWPAAPYILSDDARHFVVYIRRTMDPELYPHDIMADHFVNLTPWLYHALYWLPGKFGMDSLQAHLIIVMPLTGLLFAFAAYLFVYRFWPSPMGAAISTVILILMSLLGWRIGLAHDFGYTSALLLIPAFLSRRIVTTAGLMFIAAGLLPVAAVSSGATMAFLMASRRPPFISRDVREWAVLAAAGVACVVGAYIAISNAGEAGPTFTASEARSIPFFNPGGFRPYWGPTFVSTYVCNDNAGIVPLCGDDGLTILTDISDAQMLMWGMLVAGVISTSLWLVGSGRVGRWMSAIGLPPIDHQLARVWVAWIAAGTILFAIAHLVAFELHSPQRFAKYTISLAFGLILALAGSMLLLKMVQALQGWGRAGRAFSAGLLVASVCGLLWLSVGSLQDYVALNRTDAPNIETYLRSSPKDTLVAGVVEEIDSLPAFGMRSVLASLELLVPQKKLYYTEMANRMTALAITLYGQDPSAFAALRARYGIDYVLVERVQKTEPAMLSRWAANFPSILDTARAVKNGRQPFFRARLDGCVRANDDNLVLADAKCLVAGSGPAT